MGSRGPIPKRKQLSVRTATGTRIRQLPADADAIFRRLAHDTPDVQPADAALLELMAYWMEIAKECRRQLEEENRPPAAADGKSELQLTVTDTTHGNQEESRKNPLLIVLRTATEQIRALAVQLGASPMARARLPEVDPEGQLSFGEQFFRAAAAALQAKQQP